MALVAFPDVATLFIFLMLLLAFGVFFSPTFQFFFFYFVARSSLLLARSSWLILAFFLAFFLA